MGFLNFISVIVLPILELIIVLKFVFELVARWKSIKVALSEKIFPQKFRNKLLNLPGFLIKNLPLFLLFSVASSFIVLVPILLLNSNSPWHVIVFYVAILANLSIAVIIYWTGLPILKSRRFHCKLSDQQCQDVYCTTNNDEIVKTNERVIISLSEFNKNWKNTALIWIIIYSIELAVYSLNSKFSPQDQVELKRLSFLLFDICNILSTLVFYRCLIILNKSTFSTNNDTLWFKYPDSYSFITFYAVLLMISDTFLYFNPHHVDDYKYFSSTIAILIGLFGALTFARFAGRIDSKFMNNSGIILVLLYFYSFLQLLFGVMQSTVHFGLVNSFLFEYHFIILFALGFLLKAIIAIFLIFIFADKKIVIYLIRMVNADKILSRGSIDNLRRDI